MWAETRVIRSTFNSKSGINWGRQPSTPLQALFVDPFIAADTQPATVMTQLLGKDYANSAVLKTDTGQLKSGHNAAANISAHQTATNVKTELKEMQASFKEEVQQAQKTLEGVMDIASAEMNLDPRLARNTFFPPPQSDTINALANKFTSGATAAYDIISALPKLSPEQESKLVAKMMDLMTPKRDPITDKVVEAPKINTKYASAIEELDKKGQFTPEFLKKAMEPAEQQPEWLAMTTLEEKLDVEIAVHEEHEDSNEALAMIEKETGIELDASRKTSVDPEIVIPAIALASEALNDPNFSGVKAEKAPNVTDISELLKRNKAPDAALEIPPPKIAQAMRVSGMDGAMG